MRDLVAGGRIALGPAPRLRIDPPPRSPLALALVPLDDRRRALAACTPFDTIRRELRPGIAFDEDGAVKLDLATVPDAVARLAVVAFLATGPGGGTAFRALGAITLFCDDARFHLDLTDRADTALVLAEIYRHAGGWRMAADGGGFVGGLPALAAAFGIDPGWAERLGGGPAARPVPEDPRRSGAASGSGVAVDAHHVLTNAHVVDDADAILVAGTGATLPAVLVFADPRNDLALLRVDQPLAQPIRFRAGLDLDLGEEVVALGFPLHGLLGGGLQASGGNVAGLCGVGNDSSLFQFTAPIASGNSGGPVLDAAGQMVGLVCASLNLETVRAAGSNAENVNFGIKAAVVRSFLHAFGIVPRLAEPAAAMPRAHAVRGARDSLQRILCTC